MFCQIKTLSSCKDIPKIKRSLFFSDNSDDGWLNECSVAISPCNSILVLGKERRLSILATHWDLDSDSSVFVENWTGTLSSDITSLLILQIAAGESRESSSDWLCVVVGFNTGEVGFYTDQGQLLLSEKLDETPILNLKCHTGLHSGDTDELYVIFNESICCLPASNLIHALRYMRVQLAKGISKDFGLDQNLQIRKFGFADQDVVCDASVIGLELSNTFDHLLTASTHGGFFVGYRSFAPHNTVVVGVGSRPYISFHQALEGGNVQPILHDVARAVASKIKSALPDWLKGNKNQVQNTPQPTQTTDQMQCRFALSDLRRRGLSTVTSPDRRLLTVVDSLGRVLLIDVKRGVGVRMFKGYRNCQCGFLQVNEESHKRKNPGQKALFLVLYVAKRGLLEIWPMRGPRIAAFSVAKNARLLYFTHTMLQQGARKSSNVPTIVLLDPDGQVKHFIVPFHFALNSENSNRARDVHIIKRLRQIIKDKEYDIPQLKNEVTNIVKELNTTEMKIHCMEMMSANKNISPEIVLVCAGLLYFVPNDDEPINQEITKLNILCENLFSLVILYMFNNHMDINENDGIDTNSVLFTIEQNDEDNLEANDDERNDSPTLREGIISESELLNLQHLLNLAISSEIKRSQQTKVTFKDEKRSACSEFLGAFDLKSNMELVNLKDNITEETLLFVSQQIFNGFILGQLNWKDVKFKYTKAKTISPYVLKKLLLMFWMNLPLQDITQEKMEKFGNTLLEICHAVGYENVYVGYNETSPWWQSIRDYLVDSPCPFRSMVSAQLCRAIAIKIEKIVEKKNELDEMWESVSKDNAQWGLLIGKLDDISMLSIILSQNPEIRNATSSLPIELPDINLKYIYHKGKGSISELCAMWLCISGINPKDILDYKEENSAENNSEKLSKILSIPLNVQDKQNKTYANMSIFDKLSLLRKQFPFSLNNNNLIVCMCWEYTLYWSKCNTEFKYLESALLCIKCIESMSLRSGICSVVWTTHLAPLFESASKLIGKVGKLPREKLCKQNVGLSDMQLLKFLEFVTEFLDIFLCSALNIKEEDCTPIRFEGLWEGNSTALPEIALNNSKINVDILQNHYQLSAAIYYQCYLGSNFWKHSSNLFDVESQKYLFGPLNKTLGETMFHQSTDSRVMMQRTNFLSRLVQKCVELATDREVWIEHLQDLARLWRVNDDHIRGEYVVCLYAHGLDAEAEEALLSVTNIKPLIDVLIPMAGRRLKYFVDNCKNRSDVISVLPTKATNYLKDLEEVSNETIIIKTLDATRRLIEIIMTQSEHKSERHAHKIAAMLLDACIILQEQIEIEQ